MLRVCLISLIAFLAIASPAAAADIAELLYYKTPVYKTAAGERKTVVRNNLHGNQRVRLWVIGQEEVDGQLWLRVRLPLRPNNNKGWINASRAYLRQTSYRVVVDRSSRTLFLFHGGKRLIKTKVIVGKPSTPTPLGRFAIWDRYRPPTKSPLRPWVLEITAHSEKLRRYEGGEGRVALHGMRGPLVAPLGTAASNGCVRLPDWLINLLADKLSLGTPVTVRD